MEWIKCSDRMPEDTQIIIVCSDKNVFCARYFVATRHLLTRIENEIKSSEVIEVADCFVELNNDCEEKILENITHWMPLPNKPKESYKTKRKHCSEEFTKLWAAIAEEVCERHDQTVSHVIFNLDKDSCGLHENNI